MLHRLSVGNKLNMLLIAALLGVMAISGLALYTKYQRMLDDRRVTLQSVVQVALGVLDFYDKQAKSGAMPMAAAQASTSSRSCAAPATEVFSTFLRIGRQLLQPMRIILIFTEIKRQSNKVSEILPIWFRRISNFL